MKWLLICLLGVCSVEAMEMGTALGFMHFYLSQKQKLGTGPQLPNGHNAAHDGEEFQYEELTDEHTDEEE